MTNDESSPVDFECLLARHRRLYYAVEAIYYSAHWTPDRPVSDAAALWTELRDAAGFEPGRAPEPSA